MAEEKREGLPSPMDTSPEAVLARRKAREEKINLGPKPAKGGILLQTSLKQPKTENEGGIPQESFEILRKAAETIGATAEIQKQLARGQYELEFPEDHETQLKYVRTILNGIENSNRDCHDWSISAVVKNLESGLDRLFPDIAEEVKARLTVHDSSELIKQAGGWIERKTEEVGPGYTIGSAATEAARRGHGLDRRTIDLFLRRGIPGLKISEAWDLIQEANFDYKKFVAEVNQLRLSRGEKEYNMEDPREGFELRDDEISAGKVPTNFFVDSNSVRKEEVRNLLIAKLGGGEVGRKSVQLAEKLAIASLETSVFNRTSMAGNDELAEIIGLKGWRMGRRETGRGRGPKIHEEAIPGFGMSWLRLHGKNKVGVERPLYAKEIDIDGIQEGNYVYYCTVIVTRYNLLKKLLLNRKPEPLSIDKTFLQAAVVYFNTADKPYLTDEEKKRFGGEDTPEAKKYLARKKCGALALRVWWLAGVVDIALADINLKWDVTAFNELRKAAIVEELSPEAGTFITPEQWAWIEKATRLKRRLSLLTSRRVLLGVSQKVFSP